MQLTHAAASNEEVAEGLRQRKKRERRALIAQTAMRLFAEQGYGATTITQIAREADVAPRTVSLYFPAKEDLVFADADATFARLEAELADRAKDETFADAMRRWLANEVEEWRKHPEQLAAQRKIVDAETALQAVELRNRAHVHDAIAQAISDDFGMDRDDLESQMVAAATIAIFDVIDNRLRTDSQQGTDVLGEGMLELFDRALVFVRAGMAALNDS